MSENKKIVFLQIVDGTIEDYNAVKALLHTIKSDYQFLMGRKSLSSITKEELKELIKNL